ncbi:MAG: type II secretion system GspH family protein [Silvanigrellaceae bacterium]|nr:type II secretion system GspH family protein [Silvanigrellaceae bacterium]
MKPYLFCKKKLLDNHAGFSLIELIIVLGIIAVLAGIILPNLGFSSGSQMSLSIRNLTSMIRTTFDNAVFTRRTHRMVFDFKKGEYWIEQAPFGYQQRPTIPNNKDDVKFNEMESLVAKANRMLTNIRQMPSSTEEHMKTYSIRDFVVQQKKALEQVKWNELNEVLLFRQKLVGDVIFVRFETDLMGQKFDAENRTNDINSIGSKEKESQLQYGYIYFFSSGVCNQANIQLSVKNTENTSDISNFKKNFTVELNSFTGRSNLYEGFHDAQFSKKK